MRRAAAGLLGVLLATSACQPRTTPVVRASHSPAPQTAAASPVAAPRLLQKPKDEFSALTGSVKLDAAYIVAQGGGNIISGNGSAVVAGGGSIISTNGGGIISGNGSAIISGNGSAIISTNGSAIVAQGAGNIISGNGSAIVAQGAGNIVAQGGGNIISTNGGGIVAQGGGNAVAKGGETIVAAGGGIGFVSQRRVLAAPVGQLPVAGMPLGLYSLATHEALPVGVDGDGQPVYTVYTDAQGRYELYPPAGETGNLLVVAHVLPQSQDPRFHVALVTPAGAGADLDEDSVALTALIRKSFVRRLERILVADDAAIAGVTRDLLGEFPELPQAFAGPLADMVAALHTNAATGRLVGLKPEEVQPLAQRVADLMVRELALNGADGVKIVPTTGPAVPYFPAMLAAFKRCREGAASHDAAYFDAQPYFQAVQARRKAAGLPPYRIQKAADFNAFAADEYFAEPDPQALAAKAASAATPDLFGILDAVMASVGVADQAQTLRSAHNALLTALMFKFVEGQACEASLRHRVGDMIRGGLAGSPPPVPTKTCEPS